MGFAIHPAPGRANDAGDAHGRGASSPSAGTTLAGDSTRTSSISSLDGGASDDGHPPPPPPGHTLEAPSRRHRSGRHGGSRPAARLFQKLRTVLPVLTLAPRCGRPSSSVAGASSSGGAAENSSHLAPRVISFSGAARPRGRLTGTLYGHRKGRVALALQESPRCLPSLVVELALQTHALLRELGNPAGARIVLETERRAAASDPGGEGNGGAGGRRRRSHGGGPPLLDEPRWTMFCNGRKTGYAVRREATGDDLTVMETLRAVSMGAGVLPAGRRSSSSSSASPAASGADDAASDEVPYMRGSFDHFVGSRDSESLYMVAPQGGGTGPELAVFFVRL